MRRGTCPVNIYPRNKKARETIPDHDGESKVEEIDQVGSRRENKVIGIGGLHCFWGSKLPVVGLGLAGLRKLRENRYLPYPRCPAPNTRWAYLGRYLHR